MAERTETGRGKAGGKSAGAGKTAAAGAGKSTKAGGRGSSDGKGSATPASSRARGTSGTGKAAARTKAPNLKKDLRDFASARPQGWDHDDWLGFLESLQSRGHNIEDREAIGTALEKERLLIALGGIKGIGPQKRQSLVDYYGNLWQLRHADPDEIARVGSLQRNDAERIKSELR